MREEVRSSATAAEPFAVARSSSPPPTPVASSAGASSPAAPTNAASIDWLGSANTSKVGSLSQTAPLPPQPSANAVGSSHPSCRPWERGDLLHRLATFKPSSWLSNPKLASLLACAQKGWVNVCTDKIECESCGAQLTLTVPPSWTPAEVENAGETFAEQLDSGHQVTCPWRGNSCAGSLVQFELIPSALIGSYKDRYDGMMQFVSLPVIALSAIEHMKLSRSMQIDRFLTIPPDFLSGENSAAGAESSQHNLVSSYSQAQKLISLCGWEPRWFPNVQDYEENSTQSTKNVHLPSHSTETNKHPSQSSTVVRRCKGKGKVPVQESGWSTKSPLLDCSLCGATVMISDFQTVSRPARFGMNSVDIADAGKKLPLTRGASATSAIVGWVSTEGLERDQIDDGKSLSNAGVDLNLTMGSGLPLMQAGIPGACLRNVGDMGRDLMIGQPTGSEVGDRAASYESRGPSSRKRQLEEGGSTADKPPQSRINPGDSIEGTVIDREADEGDDSAQDSARLMKRTRCFDIFESYRPSQCDEAGPSHICFQTDIDDPSKDIIPGSQPSTKESTRASSVIAMDTVCHGADDDSMESVENNPGDLEDVQFPSPSVHRNLEINDGWDFNNSNQAQQSTCLQIGGPSTMREVGGGSVTNEGGGDKAINTETVTAYARGEQGSVGLSGGSVGMGASHEAEIHGADVSAQQTNSIVGDIEPVAEVTENLVQTCDSTPGTGNMDGFLIRVGREDLHGDNDDVLSHSIVRADSGGSKIYGSTKADNSVESGEKHSHAVGHDDSVHPSLSCNAAIYSSFDVSKEEVTQTKNLSASADEDAFQGPDYDPGNGITGTTNGENDCEMSLAKFDPIRHHRTYCPWVNGDVAAACCNGHSDTSSWRPLCGWELTLDALDTLQSFHVQNHSAQSDSAASLYKDDRVSLSQKLPIRPSTSKTQGKY